MELTTKGLVKNIIISTLLIFLEVNSFSSWRLIKEIPAKNIYIFSNPNMRPSQCTDRIGEKMNREYKREPRMLLNYEKHIPCSASFYLPEEKEASINSDEEKELAIEELHNATCLLKCHIEAKSREFRTEPQDEVLILLNKYAPNGR